MLAGPSDLVDKLTAKLDIKPDCSNFNELPRLGFSLAGRVLNLAPDDYMDRSDGGGCDFSVMQLDVPPPKGPLFIFGDPFLRRFVTIYDRSGPSVGFAVAKRDGMDANAAAQIISNAEGGGGTTMESGGSPTAAMNAAMNGGNGPAAQSGPEVTVSLDAGMMNGDSSGDDQRAPADYDSHTDDVQSTTDAAPIKEDSPDRSSGVAPASASDSNKFGMDAASESEVADWFKDTTAAEVKQHQTEGPKDDATVKVQDFKGTENKDSFDGYKTWTPTESSSSTSDSHEAFKGGDDSPKQETKTESAVDRMRHLFALQRKAGAYIQLFKDAAGHKQKGLITVKLHKAK
jgi:hypothetical protein